MSLKHSRSRRESWWTWKIGLSYFVFSRFTWEKTYLNSLHKSIFSKSLQFPKNHEFRFIVDYFLASLQLKRLPGILLSMVIKIVFFQKFPISFCKSTCMIPNQDASSFSPQVMVPSKGSSLPPIKGRSPEHHKPFSASPHGHMAPVLAQMLPPLWSPPPSHAVAGSLLGFPISSLPGLFSRLDHYLGELFLCPTGLCTVMGLSLIDITPLAGLVGRELAHPGAQDRFAERRQLKEARKHRHSFGIIYQCLSVNSSHRNIS